MTDRKEYTFQGHQFTLKPQTKANIDRVHEIIQENARKRGEMIEWVEERVQEVEKSEDELDKDALREQAADELGYTEVAGEFEIRFEIFRAAVDGPHDKIDHSELTWPELEGVRTDFLPPQMRLLSGQTPS